MTVYNTHDTAQCMRGNDVNPASRDLKTDLCKFLEPNKTKLTERFTIIV